LVPTKSVKRRFEPVQEVLREVVVGRVAVTAREVLMTIALICQPVPGEQSSFNQRMTRVFMEGLRPVQLPADAH
jgi:hypothetical protein